MAAVDSIMTLATEAVTDIMAEPTPAPAEVAAEVPEEIPTETLYIQNLNEKVKVDGVFFIYSVLSRTDVRFLVVLKQTLRSLFKSYGEVLDVVAHGNLRMRGQAFVSFENPETSKKALKEVQGFPLYSRPMVSLLYDRGTLSVPSRSFQQISYAKSRSDAVVRRLDGNNYDAHKSQREEHKSRCKNLVNSYLEILI